MEDSLAISLVTCSQWPSLFASDSALANELRRRGHHVTVCAWNDAPLHAFTDADIVVLRANWDYHHDLEAFEAWLSRLEKSGVELHNPAPLVREYLDKRYLERLSAAGLPTPLTHCIDDLDDGTIETWAADQGLKQLVIKPAWGASGHGVELVRVSELDVFREQWQTVGEGRPALLQEFVPQIRDGERSLVFFDGEFSHGLHRLPHLDDFRANSQFGSTTSLAGDIDAAMIALGKQVLASFPVPATYARIDMVGRGDDLVLMEVEVNEPSLGLDLAPGSAARFADVLLGKRAAG